MQKNIPAVYLVEASMQPPMEILHFEANPEYEVLQTDRKLSEWAARLEDGWDKSKQRLKEKASNLHAKVKEGVNAAHEKVKNKANAAVEKVREKTKEQRKRLAKRIYNVDEDSDNDEDL